MEVMMKRVCIVGASGKLGRYMVQQALDRGYEVVGVCRERSAGKLAAFRPATGRSSAGQSTGAMAC
jgi:nucleoside-diphosphate-sugar epimerase